MAIQLVPLCTMRAQLKPPIAVGTGPAGTRLIFEAEKGDVDGDRLSGEVTSADWLVVGPEGTATIDARTTFRTHDGAVVFAQYHGRMDVSEGMDLPKTIYVTPASRPATSATRGSTGSRRSARESSARTSCSTTSGTSCGRRSGVVSGASWPALDHRDRRVRDAAVDGRRRRNAALPHRRGARADAARALLGQAGARRALTDGPAAPSSGNSPGGAVPDPRRHGGQYPA